MIQKLITLLFALSCTFVTAGENERETIYRAYLTNDMPSWKATIDAMHAEADKSNERELELLNYEYGYIGWCLGSKRKSEAKRYLERSLERIGRLKKANHRLPLLQAYESAYLGYQIALSNLKAPRLGPKSLDAAKKSVAGDDRNALGYIQLGNIDYFMPPLFGGSKERAIEHYLRAERLMAPNGKGDWNYLALLVQIATAYEETGNIAMADRFYRKVLSLAPGFSWVRDELYPAFTKKHDIK